ncbi:MAG: tellurite resistance/C4-dicarboxylate transporter family protein [Acidimicrobiia bacterium]
MSTTRSSALATLFPGYFALVMATGIIAIGADQQDLGWLSAPLFWIAVVAHVVLAAMLTARAALHRRALVTDATSHAKGFAFLTTIAATNVVGAGCAVIHEWWDVARVLWFVGLVLWVLFAYATLFAVILIDPKPGLQAGINGTWFLLTVSLESIAVLGALLVRHGSGDGIAFTSLCAFVLGLILYVVVMTMVFLRWTFHPLEPTEADPPAWIAAGAVAITVLAGSNLLLAREASARLERVAPFVEGVVVLAWATSTFWLPVMIAIGTWRHVLRRVPLRYHPSYWALVFPIGMYGAATFRMRTAVALDSLGWLPKVMLFFALVAWAASAVGLLHAGMTAFRRRSPTADRAALR